MKLIEFMNMKKSHEVQEMSELICSIADYYGIKQASIFPCFSIVKILSFGITQITFSTIIVKLLKCP
jgi:hypothetical protein